ncbi:ssDNA-binding protein [Gracilibacillus halophilus YIM-C55.5]|uniref:Single-stranded-DNA-specific exonuclease RecJ n=1 Tax=Gracilibacillus halophilus YIM-C55.5 TaxID=1308866 RepID=N4WVK1_9BACI|nr:single-stranded-DNA-specific exonuclease RecJ [Gracilibacillus halophilus]ENH97091.1 ssDNA-binding protein [Gracilibacillus halophilus YIM-C55.5]
MLPSQANWIHTYKQQDISDISKLDGLNLSPIVKQLLLQRGIQTKEEAEKFLHPALDQLHEPELLTTMDKAIERVRKAVDQGESILVYGDYDADGVTSTCLMVEALREIGAMCDYYIPNRFTEGYGPNEEAFREAHRQGFQLIITVDNGIAGIKEVALANELGLDVIITDHHEVQETLPDALAIIHPKCAEDYPFKELAGVGVAFKFATALLGYLPKQFLELVAIGTVADLVPLTGENRNLVYYGLQALSNTKRIGMNTLKRLCSMEDSVTEEDIGFRIGPRLNAVGRLQDANLAVDLLLTDDPEEAEELAMYVQDLNTERQQIVSDIATEAKEMVESMGDLDEKPVIVVAKVGWNPGVLGIVASKLVQKYDRPAIVLAIDPETGLAKGSARSIDHFDLFHHCMQVRELFTHFGGHAQAAGMTLPVDQVERLRDSLSEQANSNLNPEDYMPQMKVDMSITVDQVDLDLVKEINQLAPFGMNNAKPMIHIEGQPVELRQIGATKKHLKLKFSENNKQLDCIGFGFGDKQSLITKQTPVQLIGELQLNEWNGIYKPQIVIKDLAITEWQLFDYRGAMQTVKQWDQFQPEDACLVFREDTNISSIPNLITKEQLVTSDDSYKNLYLFDLPETLEDLRQVLKYHQFERIYLCYQLENSQYFQMMPTREDFKWLYQLLHKRKYFDYKQDAPKLAKYKGWKLDKIKFMFQVFHDLEFVTREGGTILPTDQPKKKDLEESEVYQLHAQQIEIEETLYYSTYKALKKWLSDQMNENQTSEEEIVYGL